MTVSSVSGQFVRTDGSVYVFTKRRYMKANASIIFSESDTDSACASDDHWMRLGLISDSGSQVGVVTTKRIRPYPNIPGSPAWTRSRIKHTFNNPAGWYKFAARTPIYMCSSYDNAPWRFKGTLTH